MDYWCDYFDHNLKIQKIKVLQHAGETITHLAVTYSLSWLLVRGKSHHY